MVSDDLANEKDNPAMDSSPSLGHDFGDESVHLQNIASIIDCWAAHYCGESQ